jgi:hypothetical protein
MKKVALIALALPFPAFAGSFTPPEGCTAHLTVQSRGCNVANYYTCERDPSGEQWRADYDQEGLYYLSKIDFETQWVESYEQNPSIKQTLDPNPADPASFTELLATGIDTFDFNLSKDDGTGSNVKGFDRLTGETVVIDGITLRRTEFQMIETDLGGTVLRQAKGSEFISEQFRNFFAGSAQYLTGEDWLTLEGSPVQFSQAGDKGFGATQPIFDCDAVLSQAVPFIFEGLPSAG